MFFIKVSMIFKLTEKIIFKIIVEAKAITAATVDTEK